MSTDYLPTAALTWTIGDRVRKARRFARLSQEQLAERAHICRETVSLCERGNTVPLDGSLHHIAAACGVPVEYLLSGVLPEPPTPGVVAGVQRRKKPGARRSCYAPFTLLSADVSSEQAA